MTFDRQTTIQVPFAFYEPGEQVATVVASWLMCHTPDSGLATVLSLEPCP